MTIPLTSGSTIVTTPTAPSANVTVGKTSGSSVITSPGVPGPAGASLELEGTVATYADLPNTLGPNDAGKAYLVQSNGKLYVWSGTAWPLEANGASFKGDKGDTGRGVDDVTISGSTIQFHMSDASIEGVDVPVIQDALDAAASALDSAADASTSATSASTAAGNASGSATAASTSAGAAATSASNAAASATAANTSATNAGSSETTAAGYASAAAGSASAASTSAGNAATSATNAAGSATAASTAKDTAVSARDDAVNAASAASLSASDAADSASAAAQSAADAASVVNDGVPNATASIKGGIFLPGSAPGELGGTYDHPTVTGWSSKADLVGGKVPVSQIPAQVTNERYVVANQAARLALTTAQVQPGDMAIQTGNPGRGTYILNATDPSVDANWVLMVAPTDAVTSVNGYSGIVVLGKADVGLGSVDNTSDAAKPISTATQTALDGKANTVHTHAAGDITSGTIGYARLPVGTTASTVAAGDDARITGAVPSTRTITAGTGLSGGGTLASDRTLSVSYGTTAGTAAQGNDSRLSDTRTPTDGTVTDVKVAAGAAIALAKLATGYCQGQRNGTVTTTKFDVLTEAQFTALATKDPNTIYLRTA